jgi:hypothetical protein
VVGHKQAVLPELINFVQLLDIAARHIQAVQAVERGLEARDGLVGGVAGGDDQQAAVNVGLLAAKGQGPVLDAGVVGMGVLLGGVQVLVGGVELVGEEGLLGGDASQQGVEVGRVEVEGRLELVVEVVGGAVVHVGVHVDGHGVCVCVYAVNSTVVCRQLSLYHHTTTL